MRLWTIHPRYLDAKGLVALWREGLLAQNVLLGKTKGYKHHPQLHRFQQQPNPSQAIGDYLTIVCDTADQRHYKFTRAKIIHRSTAAITITTTRGQLNYEWQHFLQTLQKRDRELLAQWQNLTTIDPHPLFHIVDGDIEPYEKKLSTHQQK